MNHYNTEYFKTCPMCATHWTSQGAFLDDPTIHFNGYQANFGIMDQGLFYFTHQTDECGSTMVIRVEAFLSLYNGPRYSEDKQLSKECPRFCLDRNQLKRCQAHCRHAFIREVAQIITDR